MFKRFQALGKAIKSVTPNVPTTKKQKLLRDLKITKQKVKGATAKLKQTQFERANPQFKGKDFTFATKTGKTESNRERYKRIQKENTKVLKGMIDDAFKNVKKEKKAKGGRVGLKKGTPFKKETNVDKIKKTFGSLSVRAGIDNNPNPTYADKIAGAKMKNKKKKA